jgi:hypothetical protein
MAIIIDECICLVAENLYPALMHITFPNERVWVDAICINQEDQHEKKLASPVYVEYLSALIEKEGFQIIRYCNLQDSSFEDPELPSWVPNWSRHIELPIKEIAQIGEPASRYSLGSGEVQATLSLDMRGSRFRSLLISGSRLDIILEVGSHNQEKMLGRATEIGASWLSELEVLSVKAGNIYGSEARTSEAICRCLSQTSCRMPRMPRTLESC